MINFELIFLFLLLILLILCLLYFTQENDKRTFGEKIKNIFLSNDIEKQSDNQEETKVNDINNQDKEKSIEIEKSVEDKDGLTTYNQSTKIKTYDYKTNINPDRPFLINQYSRNFSSLSTTIDSQKIPFSECKEGYTYKVLENGDLEIRNGCIGVFSYKNKIGFCSSPADISTFGGFKRVTNDRPVICNNETKNIDSIFSSKITGFKDYNLELIQEYSDNKCKNETYGFDESNLHIYTDKGCKGLFKLGLLYGTCYSNGEYSKCKIGQTDKYENLNESDKDILPTQYVGLKHMELYPNISEVKGKICKKTDFQFIDENTFKVKNSCGLNNSTFEYKNAALNLYRGKCSPITNNGVCTIGGKERINNLIFQGIPKNIKKDIENANKKFETELTTLEENLNKSINTHKSFLNDINRFLINYYVNVIRSGENISRIANKKNDFETVYINIININNDIIKLNKKKKEYKKYCQENTCPLIDELDINNYSKFDLVSKNILWINLPELKRFSTIYNKIYTNYIKPLNDYIITKLNLQICTENKKFKCLEIDNSSNIVNIKCIESSTNPNEENCD